MSVFHNNALIGSGAGAAAAAADAGPIKSLRFNSGDSAKLSRTPSSAGNRKTFTFSCWLKRTKLARETIFSAGSAVSTSFAIEFNGSNKLDIYDYNSSFTWRLQSTAVYRDPASFFHLVLSVDTTQATASNRVKAYINGSQITDFDTSSYPSQNHDSFINNNVLHTVGCYQNDTFFSNTLLADIYFIDGSALDPTSFGAYDDNGVWQAAAYSGTFGTNGFHLLDFANESTVGHDSSGNENDFTANNIGTGGNGNYISELNNVNDFYGNGRATWGPTLFNGATGDKGPIPAAGTPMTYTPSSSITLTGTGLRIWVARKAGGIFINGNSVSATDQQWNDYGTTYSPLTSIEWRTTDGSNFSQLSAIEINGTQLIDNTAVGAGNDVLFDVPTNGTQSDTGAGGEVSGNYCVFNALNKGNDVTLSNGNLQAACTSSSKDGVFGTIGVSSGKWYWEVELTSSDSNTNAAIGIATSVLSPNAGSPTSAGAYFYSSFNGNKWLNSADSSYGASYGTGDVIGVALDLDNDTLTFYKNGSTQGDATTSLPSGTYFPYVGDGANNSAQTVVANWGQRSFSYSAPSGFKALCTTNLPTPTIADGSAQFDAKLYTSNNASLSVTGYEFSPSFVWIKNRASAQMHGLFDVVRGANQFISSNRTNAEHTTSGSGYGTGTFNSFDSNGFTLGDDAGQYTTNYPPNEAHVAWAWNAGANSNKTYTVKVVSDSGNKYRFDDFGTSAVTLDLAEGSTYIFDQSDSSNAGHPIRFGTSANGTDYTTGVTHTGTPGSAGAKTTLVLGTGVATLYYSCQNHSGMGGQINTNSTAGASNFDGSIQSTVKANPEAGFSIVSFNGTAADGTVGHGLNAKPSLYIVKNRDTTSSWFVFTDVIDGSNDYLYLDTDGAKNDTGANYANVATSSVFYMGIEVSGLNASGDDHIVYCISPVAGFSAVGSYTGDGTNQHHINLGFRPAFVLIKRTDTGAWVLIDSARSPSNEFTNWLRPNESEAESTNNKFDIVSNGFVLRKNDSFTNQSTKTFIYFAFAENPFQANGGLAR